MSPAMSALSTVGITQPILILAVLGFVAAGVIGYFWQYIVPGVIILGVIALFYVAPESETKPEVKQEKQEQVFDEHEAYLKDCMEIAEYSKAECESLWYNREKNLEADNDFKPAEDVKLLEVSNKEYKQRRAAALKKKDAVVLQTTFR